MILLFVNVINALYTPAVLSEVDLVRDNNNDCGEPLNSSGNFSSPGWNTGEPYPANLNCTWQLRHPSKPDCPNSITLTFLDVEERSRGGNCAFDKLVIQSEFQRFDFCGSEFEREPILFGDELTVQFLSDEMFEGFGWQLQIDYCEESELPPETTTTSTQSMTSTTTTPMISEAKSQSRQSITTSSMDLFEEMDSIFDTSEITFDSSEMDFQSDLFE